MANFHGGARPTLWPQVIERKADFRALTPSF